MIRILFVTDALMLGGIETQLVDLVTRLDRRHFAPSVVCLYGPRARELHFDHVLGAADIPLYCLDRAWGVWDKARIVQQLNALITIVRPHIVQAENYHSNLLTGLTHPLHPTPRFIGTQRGTYTARQLITARFLQRNYNDYIVSAPHLREQLVTALHLPPTKVTVISNGIDTARFAAPRDTTLRERLAPGIRRLLVSVGRISSQKRMHLIAEALGILKQRQALPTDAQIWIIGPIQDPPLHQLLLATMQRYDVGDNLKLHPSTDHPEDYYAASDASILYSVDESLPCVMLESLAAGRPVLISDEANVAGVIADTQTGWVAPVHDTAAFADVLATVLALPAANLDAMRARCTARAAAFDVAALVERYAAHYRALVHDETASADGCA